MKVLVVPDLRLIRAVPITVVLLVAAVGLLLIAAGHWRRGAGVLAGAAAVAAVVRLVTPDRAIGPLGVRGRAFDVVFLSLLAALLAVATTVGI